MQPNWSLQIYVFNTLDETVRTHLDAFRISIRTPMYYDSPHATIGIFAFRLHQLILNDKRMPSHSQHKMSEAEAVLDVLWSKEVTVVARNVLQQRLLCQCVARNVLQQRLLCQCVKFSTYAFVLPRRHSKMISKRINLRFASLRICVSVWNFLYCFFALLCQCVKLSTYAFANAFTQMHCDNKQAAIHHLSSM